MRMQTSLLLAITKKLNVLKCSAITRKQVEKKKNLIVHLTVTRAPGDP